MFSYDFIRFYIESLIFAGYSTFFVFFYKIEVWRANGCVYCVVEVSGIRMDVSMARGDLFLIVSCRFVCFYAFFLLVGCWPCLSGADPGCRVPTLAVGCQPWLSGAYPDCRMPTLTVGCRP